MRKRLLVDSLRSLAASLSPDDLAFIRDSGGALRARIRELESENERLRGAKHTNATVGRAVGTAIRKAERRFR